MLPAPRLTTPCARAPPTAMEVALGAELITGIASDAFLASRLTALSQIEFLGGVAPRSGLSKITINAIEEIPTACFPVPKLARKIEHPLPICPLLGYRGNGLEAEGVEEAVDKARQLRLELTNGRVGDRLSRNIAVVKVPGWNDPVHGDFLIDLSQGPKNHSEVIIVRKLEEKGFKISDITEFFTEH